MPPLSVVSPRDDVEHWRNIVLFGRNVASYKFALAKSLLEVARAEHEVVSLEDLALPFARQICEHIDRVDRQATSPQSRFLDACRYFNAGRIDENELREITVLRGFNNVIDAFHRVGPSDVPTRFFVDERTQSGSIRLTAEMLSLGGEGEFGADLELETEARWRLVEEAWDSAASGEQLTVLYDAPREILVPGLAGKRRPITEVRPALNGYQKGFCFYCFNPIRLTGPWNEVERSADVDHFIPHSLMGRAVVEDLDVPWNLVLACQPCNRGPRGKAAQIPAERYLPRLHTRNEYLIASNHPLKETLIAATGVNEESRRRFLKRVMGDVQAAVGTPHGWQAIDEQPARF